MARINRRQLAAAQKEVFGFISSEGVATVLENATSSLATWEEARRTPKRFLKKEGLTIPRSLRFELREEKWESTDLRVTVTVCASGCVRVGPFEICAEVCLTVSFDV